MEPALEPTPPLRGTLLVNANGRRLRGLIAGVANDKSLAWGIAQAVAAQGADLAFTYQGEVLEKRVRPLAESIGSQILLPCDVAKEEDILAVAKHLKNNHINFYKNNSW